MPSQKFFTGLVVLAIFSLLGFATVLVFSAADGPAGEFFYKGNVEFFGYNIYKDLTITLDNVTVEGCEPGGKGSCQDTFSPNAFTVPAGREKEIALGKTMEIDCKVLPMTKALLNRTTCVITIIK